MAAALKKGYTIDRLYELTKIDKWFLHKFKNITDYYSALKQFKGKVIFNKQPPPPPKKKPHISNQIPLWQILVLSQCFSLDTSIFSEISKQTVSI